MGERICVVIFDEGFGLEIVIRSEVRVVDSGIEAERRARNPV